jgi:pimeloyl-ACP methyl ester carboxylesterase
MNGPEQKENGHPPADSALEAYVQGPPVPEPEDVGEVPAVEPPRESDPEPAPPAAPPAEEASVLPPAEVRAILEALIFASPQPITPKEVARVLQGVPREDWEKQLEELRADYARDERGLQVVEVAGSGHALMAEKPDDVLDALRAFLPGR